MTATAVLRPRTVGEILDASFVLYRRRFGTLLLASVVLSLPTLAGAILLSHASGDAFHTYFDAAIGYFREIQNSQGRPTPEMQESVQAMVDASLPMQGYAFLSAGMQALSRAGSGLACAFAVIAVVRGETVPGAWALVRRSLPRLPAATAILVALTVVNVVCAICVPLVVVFAGIFAPAAAVLALEAGPLERATWSWSFAPARWIALPFASTLDATARCVRLSWHAMTILRGSFAMVVLLTLVSAVVTVVAGAAAIVDRSFGLVFVLNHCAEVLFLPVIGVTSALWYIDLRVRREGLDLA